VSHGVLNSIVVPVGSAGDSIGILTDPGSHRCRGVFYTHRVVASRVLLTGVLVLHRARRGGAQQDSQCRGWLHNAWDGGTGLGMAAQGRR
jgi:hypothetical protein